MAEDRRIDRRRFIVGGAAVLGGGALSVWIANGDRSLSAHHTGGPAGHHGPDAVTSSGTTQSSPDGPRWSDPASWTDGVPAAGSTVRIDSPIVLDVDADVAGLVITETGSLTFAAERTCSLVSSGNVVVHGSLVMRPVKADIDHGLTFVDVDEGRYAGEVMDAPDTDVGLWVMHTGILDLAGTPRRGWTSAAASLPAGADAVDVVTDPTGWLPGDELVITPTGTPADETGEDEFEIVHIDSVSGRTVRLRERLAHDHPAVDVGGARTMTAEILNLTRNVRIEGTPDGRAHVMVHTAVAQAIGHAAFRHLGPRRPDGDGASEGYIGRYPLHFHICEDGSRGSTVEGVVVRDAGHHGFVPHTSHGITFTDCVSYDTVDDPYWWDQAPDTRTPGPATHDTVYDRCVAALVRFDPPFRGYRLSGFTLSRGDGNVARGCVAVGVQGTADAAGFHWPENSEGVWTFTDCVAHHSLNGIFTWQNTSVEHTITEFVAYHNHGAGISHGAYANPYRYASSILYGNVAAAVILHAVSRDDGLRFENLVCDGAGLSDYLVVAARHTQAAPQPTLFSNCHFAGAGAAAFGLTYEGEDGGSEPDVLEIVDCVFEGNELWLADGIDPATEVRIRDAVHGDLVARRHDQAGEPVSEWNAKAA